jgi:hypothetical protein
MFPASPPSPPCPGGLIPFGDSRQNPIGLVGIWAYHRNRRPEGRISLPGRFRTSNLGGRDE